MSSAPTTACPPPSVRARAMAACLPVTLVLAVGLAFASSFQGAMVFDDQSNIVENRDIQTLWPPGKLLASMALSMRPIVNLSLAINYALGGVNPFGYHLFNLAIHLAATLTLYGLVRRTLLTDRLRPWTGAAAGPLAWTVALLWAIHPVQVASVTYIIQRAESMMGLFYLLTLYCLVRAAERGEGILPLRPAGVSPAIRAVDQNVPADVLSHRGPSFWQIAAIVACCLGMGTKQVMVTAPVMALLYDRVFLSGSFGEALRRRRGLYAGFAATWLVVGGLLAARLMAPEPLESAGYGVKTVTWVQYALTQPAVVTHYLAVAFWPDHLAIDYDWPPAQHVGDVLPYALLIAALAGASLWALLNPSPFGRGWPEGPGEGSSPSPYPLPRGEESPVPRRCLRTAAGFCGAWFFLILLPTSSIMPIKDLAFDHRIYLSLAGPVALAVVGLYVLARKVLPKEASPLLYTAAATLVLVAAVGLGAKTYQRNFAFRDSIALWRDTLQSRPRNVRALYNLALFLSDKGEVAEAEKLYREAIGVKADYADAHNNLANILAGQGRYPEAIDHFELAIQFDPELAQAHNNYAGVLAQMAMRSPPGSPSFDHNMARSREHYEQALRLRDDYPLARCNFATILARLGKPAEAAEQYRRVLAEHPDFPRAHAELAGIDEMEGRPAEAIAHLRLAVKYRMDWPEFLLHAAWTFATSDDPSLADGKEALEAALRVCKDENNAQHMDVLAAAYAQAGQFDRAVDRADRAAALARVAGHADQAAAIAERLDLYKSRKPYREQVVTTAPASQPDRQ